VIGELPDARSEDLRADALLHVRSKLPSACGQQPLRQARSASGRKRKLAPSPSRRRT